MEGVTLDMERFRQGDSLIFKTVFGCLVGTFLLATHGNLKSLSLSPQALFWGALSSLALAFYTVYPVRLLAKYDAMLLIGWSILVLSFVMHFVHPSWDYAGNWNTSTASATCSEVSFVIP